MAAEDGMDMAAVLGMAEDGCMDMAAALADDDEIETDFIVLRMIAIDDDD